MDVLLEGIRDLSQACSLALIIPGLAVLLAARRRRGWVLAGLLGSVWLFAWMKAAGWLPGTPNAVTSVGVGLLFLGSGWVAWRMASASSGVSAGIVAGALATWLWVPCVGIELAGILNAAPEAPFAQLVPMGLFVLGLSVPLLVVALLPVVWPQLEHALPHVATGSLVLVGLIGLSMIVGWYDDVVIQLNRWSIGAI